MQGSSAAKNGAQDKGIAVYNNTGLKSPFRVWGKNLEILCCLSEFGGLTVKEISQKTLINEHTVYVSCRRDLERGLVEIDSWGFRLSVTGLQILTINNNNNSSQITHKQVTNKSQITHKWRQLSLSPYLESKFSEPDLAITQLLISHYNDTGEPFIYIESELDFCEKLNFPPEMIAKALRKLRQGGICYKYWDRNYGKNQLRLKVDNIRAKQAFS